MKRDELDFTLEFHKCKKGGIKEACIKAREFTHFGVVLGSTIQSPYSCVQPEEFMEAVSTLIAYVFDQEDIVPIRWRCDSDECQHADDYLCPGECNIRKGEEKLCPFFAKVEIVQEG